ncbi:MAG: type IV pilus modification PilV family protein, partial [Candidatus Dormibacteria bacterium]
MSFELQQARLAADPTTGMLGPRLSRGSRLRFVGRDRRGWARSVGRARFDDGFTLVEVLVAITLLLIVLLPSSLLLERGLRVTTDTKERVVAIDLATQAIEKVRQQAVTTFSSIPINTISTSTQIVGGVNYTTTLNTQFVSPNNGTVIGGPCTSGPNGQSQVNSLILSVASSVTWVNDLDVQPITETTTVSPPAGYFQQNAGQ